MRFVTGLGFMLLAGFAVATPTDGYLSYSGTAVARRTSQFLYTEQHVLLYQGGRLAERAVLYTCRDGTPFARKIVSYVDRLAPDFSLDDVASGEHSGIRSEAGGRAVYYRAGNDAVEKVGPLPRHPGLIADAGFDEFVQSHWQQLLEDQALQVRFLVPTRLDDYAFQVQHVRSERFQGIPAEVFRLRLSGLWGWFLPGIDVYYGARDRVLLHYDGLSDLRDAAGDNYLTKITFNPADRQAADAGLLRRIEQAPLARCR